MKYMINNVLNHMMKESNSEYGIFFTEYIFKEHSMKRSIALILILSSFVIGCAHKNTDTQTLNNPETKENQERLYTFSWSYDENSGLKPRGGTTKGAPVHLDTTENTAWLSINEPGISKFEKDRRAILAMAGDYRVTFDFIETVPLKSGYKIRNPYQSWATEFIKVIEDRGDFISLQHVLVMYIVNDEGVIQDPIVVKHWRQDWTYQDNEILEYKGNNTWQERKIPVNESLGTWSQAVYQVDDTPRYEALGIWVHDSNYSAWTTPYIWRPLPRREFSARDDYNVLVSENRIIINPGGWVHEQNNIKLVVDDNGVPVKESPYLAKEVGLNRYERITGTDFTPGIDYWTNTAEFWKDVRDAWAEALSQDGIIKINSTYQNKKLYEYLFEYADHVTKENYNTEEGSHFAAMTINNFIIKTNDKPDSSVY